MLKITKASTIVLIFYILFYLQVWGDNHLLLYGSALVIVISTCAYCIKAGYVNLDNVPFGVQNNLIMVVYCLITGAFVVQNYSAMLKSLITFLAFSAVCFAICYVSSEEESFEWVIKTLAMVALICALYALFNGTMWKGYGITLSQSNTPHSFAAVMFIGIFSAAYLGESNNGIKRRVLLILVLFFYYCIIESGSRKYTIASTCMIIMWLFGHFKRTWNGRNRGERAVIIIAFFLLIFVCIFLYRHVYVHSYSYIRMNESDDLGNQHRIRNYCIALQIFLDHPLFGGGYDQFKFLSGLGGYSHSTYAEAIADFGGIGCVLYFSPILYLTYSTVKRVYYTRHEYISLLLFALCISELFLGLGQIFFMEFYHFLIWTILFYCARIQKESNKCDKADYKVNWKYLKV